MTASQEMTCFLLFDKLCDYIVQNFVVSSSNSADGTYIENSSWKVLAYGIYTRVVFVLEIKRVRRQRTSEISDTKTTSG